jgi:hypothetical protein
MPFIPKYDLARIQELVRQGNWAWANDSARTNFWELNWTNAKFEALLCSLRQTDAKKTSLGQTVLKGFGKARQIDVDHYVIRWEEVSETRCSEPSGLSFFIKIAIDSPGDKPDRVAIVSFHLS